MRLANIIAAIAIATWCGVIVLGRSLVSGVVDQHVIGYPSIGQIDAFIVWPALVAVLLLIATCICNSLRRRFGLLGGLAVLMLLGAPIYLVFWGGGV